MKETKIEPVCEVEIVDPQKVLETKKKISNVDQVLEMADIFKLLGEPTRLKIVLSLINSELCVCDLAAAMEANVSTVSHQLRLLRNARLVKYRKEGKMVFYSIDDNHIADTIKKIKEHTEE
ncbi:MAG: metalloregulator ArsR/SmtB family transcription factor [Bacteroidetes bacterium]|nr:metalloregulator ArsR/SmtB family transcription factor [Bacteroidota bacterium]MBU1115542.1 metalloregulator ArsR/SmtB family transcription factor [Bacteroidota bacterium]MBU1797698.1 metalloregulator ArsR/SmtB family transcription factor [Bacteroidota bacterium]